VYKHIQKQSLVSDMDPRYPVKLLPYQERLVKKAIKEYDVLEESARTGLDSFFLSFKLETRKYKVEVFKLGGATHHIVFTTKYKQSPEKGLWYDSVFGEYDQKTRKLSMHGIFL
jgi:hypothetical protein